MKTILIILASLFTFLTLAQNPPTLWQKNIGGSGNEGLFPLKIPNSTDYFLIGYSDSDISGDKTEISRGFTDIWILRLDQTHTILWDKTIGGDGFEWFEDAKIYNDTLYVIARSNSNISGEKTMMSFGGYDNWLISLDLSGNILWQNQYGGSNNESKAKIVFNANNNLIIGSTSDSNISGNKTENSIGQSDIWMLECNTSDGSIINQNTIGSSNKDDFKNLIIDNNFIHLLCQSEVGISGDKTDVGYGSFDVWLIKIDLNLNVLQDKCFGGTGDENNLGGSFILNNNFLYIVASSSSIASGNKTAPYWDSYDAFDRNDVWILKIDNNYSLIWDKSFGGNADDYGVSIHSQTQNRFVISSNSESINNGNKTAPKYGNFDVWLIIVDSLGAEIVQESYGGTLNDYGGTYFSSPNSIYFSSFSNSGISGNKTVPTNGGSDAWLMEIDASGFLNTESIEGVNR